MVGMGLDTSIENLALSYLSTIQGLAYGTKHIVDALEAAGHTKITAIYVSGRPLLPQIVHLSKPLSIP